MKNGLIDARLLIARAITSRFRVRWRRYVEVDAFDQYLHAAIRLPSGVVLVSFGNYRLVCLTRHTRRPQHATTLRLNLVRGNLVIDQELPDGLRSLQREVMILLPGRLA